MPTDTLIVVAYNRTLGTSPHFQFLLIFFFSFSTHFWEETASKFQWQDFSGITAASFLSLKLWEPQFHLYPIQSRAG